jgi:hypothetical protein
VNKTGIRSPLEDVLIRGVTKVHVVSSEVLQKDIWGLNCFLNTSAKAAYNIETIFYDFSVLFHICRFVCHNHVLGRGVAMCT